MPRPLALVVACLALLALSTAAVSAADVKEQTRTVKSVDSAAKQIVLKVGNGKDATTETFQVPDDVKFSWIYAKDRPASIDDIKPKYEIVFHYEDGKLTRIKIYTKPPKN